MLENNPAASLWRADVFAGESRWAGRQEGLRGRLVGALAVPASSGASAAPARRRQTALALGDIGGAQRSWISYALANTANPVDDAKTRLVAATVAERQGNVATALAQYQALAQLPMDEVSGPAQLHVTQLQLTAEHGDAGAGDRGVFDGLRFRWRGRLVPSWRPSARSASCT